MPESVTVATIRHAQAARNPSVIAVLRQFRLTEDAGRGVDVMQDVMRDEMLDPPIFEEIGEFVHVTLPIKGPITPQERAWLKDLEEGGTLKPAERLLLAHAARRQMATRLEFRGGSLLKVGESTMQHRLTNAEVLRRLTERGLLERRGEKRGTEYVHTVSE
ncbi:MAG: ATP-binding protein [Pseudonocardiaceae bacterium]